MANQQRLKFLELARNQIFILYLFYQITSFLKAMNKKTLVGISYVSAWVIIWGTIGSLIDFYFLQNTYLPGSLGQYLTLIITAIISSITAIYGFPIITKKYID